MSPAEVDERAQVVEKLRDDERDIATRRRSRFRSRSPQRFRCELGEMSAAPATTQAQSGDRGEQAVPTLTNSVMRYSQLESTR